MSFSGKWAGVFFDYVDSVWSDVKPFIERALAEGNGDYTAEEIRESLKSREMQMWVVFEEGIRAVVVTRISEYPSKKVAIVVLLAGDGLKDWIHLLSDILEPWAKEKGCSQIRAYCRPGFERILKWKRFHVALGKDL